MLSKRALFAGAAFLAAAAPASATTLTQLDLNGLVDGSNSIVVGQATSQSYQMTNDGLYTVTTFSVSDTITGSAGGSVTVAVPGGIQTINGRRFAETWPGAPTFAVGEEAVLFLNNGAAGNAGVVGFSQGVLPVFASGGGKMVRLPGESKAMDIQKAKAEIRKAGQAKRVGD